MEKGSQEIGILNFYLKKISKIKKIKILFEEQ